MVAWEPLHGGPVKPFENVTFPLIVAPFEMLPCSAVVPGREPPVIAISLSGRKRWKRASRVADERQEVASSVSGAQATAGPRGGARGRTDG